RVTERASRRQDHTAAPELIYQRERAAREGGPPETCRVALEGVEGRTVRSERHGRQAGQQQHRSRPHHTSPPHRPATRGTLLQNGEPNKRAGAAGGRRGWNEPGLDAATSHATAGRDSTRRLWAHPRHRERRVATAAGGAWGAARRSHVRLRAFTSQVYPDYRPPRGSRMPKTAAMVNPTVTWIRAWSGRPGQSPTRGSHGSGRARLTHPALRIMGSLHDDSWSGRRWLRGADSGPRAEETVARTSATVRLGDSTTSATGCALRSGTACVPPS